MAILLDTLRPCDSCHHRADQPRSRAIYVLAPGIKGNPERRWALPDRVFFACGACHILAYAALGRFPECSFQPIWIKPAKGYTGNHIVAVSGDLALDYHGYASWPRLLAHSRSRAERRWPGWHAELVPLPPDVLVSEAKSLTYDGLWLREPGQFLHDALARAEQFLDRLGAPPLTLSPCRSCRTSFRSGRH